MSTRSMKAIRRFAIFVSYMISDVARARAGMSGGHCSFVCCAPGASA